MGNIKRITINGPVVGKQRIRGGKFGYYTPKRTIEFEELVKDSYLELYSLDDIIKKPHGVSLKIVYHKKIPKSYSKKKVKAILNGKLKNIVKPDNDNYEKSIMDALNKIAYEDDSQVFHNETTKVFTPGESYTEIFIKEY